MRKILLFVCCFISLLFSSDLKHIPFGIKDTCEKITKNPEYTLCENNSFKWISFSFDKTKNKNIELSTIIESKQASSINTQGFKLINAIPYNNKNHQSLFIINDQNIDNYNTINNIIHKKINETQEKDINILQGVVTPQDAIGFEVNNKKISLPEYYFIVLTDIKNRKIIDIHILDFFKNEVLEDTNTNFINTKTNTDFLYKIHN